MTKVGIKKFSRDKHLNEYIGDSSHERRLESRGLCSDFGASYRILELIPEGKFEFEILTVLILEYVDVFKLLGILGFLIKF